MAHQLTFDLAQVPALDREAFFVSPANATALALLEGWETWPARKMLLLGPNGSGKTHLAHVWAAQASAQIVSAVALVGTDVPELARRGAVVVEDADQPGLDEAALFHLHNLLLAEGGHLLLTATLAPKDWPLGLPDLASRMQGTPAAQLEPPDDTLLQAVMVKQFADRQLHVPPNLLPYLMGRMDRSFAAARALVDALDHAALSERRPITRAFAARVLDKLAADAP